MLTDINSSQLYNSISNYSLYSTSNEETFLNPYLEDEDPFAIDNFQTTSIEEMESSINTFENNIENLETDITNLQESLQSDQEILENTENFIESYNTTLNSLQSSDNINSLEAANDLSTKADYASEDLAQIGIQVNDFGELNLDEEKFNEVLTENPDKIENTLDGQTGFLNSIEESTEEIKSDPASSYIDWNSGLNLYTSDAFSSNLFQSGMIMDFYS